MAGRTVLLIVISLLSRISFAQHFEWHTVQPQTDASFRALSVINDSVAWVAGTKGWIGITVDGGTNWSFSQVKGFESFDFRSLYAFDDSYAVVANAGAPANILVTDDGGKSWHIVYTHPDTAAFFDGIDFFDRNNGLIYGDPIDGKMLMLSTRDGGRSWVEVPDRQRPVMMEGEASFAASGTNIRCFDKQFVAIGTGGKTSRLWTSTNGGKSWKTLTPPVLHGESSTGIFSFSGFRGKVGVIVGGDYLRDTLAVDHVFYTTDKGKSWERPVTPTRGYRECVEFIDDNTLVATGPTGTEVSTDGGKTWKPESDERLFHVVRKARNGNLIVIAGGKGKISVLKKK